MSDEGDFQYGPWFGDPDTESEVSLLSEARRQLKVENRRLRRALADLQAFIAAVQGLRDHQAMRLEVERLRMRLEDRR